MLKFSDFFRFSSENSWILQEFSPNSDLNSWFGSVPRRPNLSAQVCPDRLGGDAAARRERSAAFGPGRRALCSVRVRVRRARVGHWDGNPLSLITQNDELMNFWFIFMFPFFSFAILIIQINSMQFFGNVSQRQLNLWILVSGQDLRNWRRKKTVGLLSTDCKNSFWGIA